MRFRKVTQFALGSIVPWLDIHKTNVNVSACATRSLKSVTCGAYQESFPGGIFAVFKPLFILLSAAVSPV